VGFSTGWKKLRQPLRAGGKDFARDLTLITASENTNFIAGLLSEDNQVRFRGRAGGGTSPVIRYMANRGNPR